MPFYVIAGDYSKSIHHFLKGYRSDLQGDLDEAIENYRSALLYNQKSSSLMSELSFAYIKRGELNKAESILNEAITNSIQANATEIESHYPAIQPCHGDEQNGCPQVR